MIAAAERFLRRPQRTWIRRVNFQVHLWLGLLLALYLIVIGLTGSILVFRHELEPKEWAQSGLQPPMAELTKVINDLRDSFPDQHVISINTPTEEAPYFAVTLQGHAGRFTLACDPHSGKPVRRIKRTKSWLTWVQDLHITLLAGPNGRAANGIGGGLLLLLNATGMVIWWPGMRAWTRGFLVDWRRRWRRVNFDLHSAVGFWTLSIVSFWALSGVYFGWSEQVFRAVNKLSPVISAQPPTVHVYRSGSTVPFDLQTLLDKSERLDPGTRLASLAFPYSRTAPLEIFRQRQGGIGREYTDTLYFNPSDGSYIQMWRYGVNESLGDWFIWLQVPLHYGTFWGMGVKIAWALLGFSIPLLTITGLILYWNRFLSKHLPLGLMAIAPQWARRSVRSSPTS